MNRGKKKGREEVLEEEGVENGGVVFCPTAKKLLFLCRLGP